MSILKTIWFLWWGWNPEKVENWLEDMESKGWNLYQVDMWGIRFRFKKGESRKVRYCVDYQSDIEDQYIKIFNDDGWELTWNDAGGWYIWQKSYIEERPSIYSDLSSLVERNNRLAKVLRYAFIFLIPAFLFLLVTNWRVHYLRYFLWIYICIFALYGFIFYQIRRFNKKLKEDNIRE